MQCSETFVRTWRADNMLTELVALGKEVRIPFSVKVVLLTAQVSLKYTWLFTYFIPPNARCL